MGKLSAQMLDLNISDGVFSNNEDTLLPVIDFSVKKSGKLKNLSAAVQYFCKINDIENELTGVYFGFDNIVLNTELSNSEVRYIAQELAAAVDSNSVLKIKELKKIYGHKKEFADAKKFLNQKCKEVWNVFDSKNTDLKFPYEAMKSLGITNQPELEFLLGDSVRFYEKDGGKTTGDIISSVLNNKHLSYSMKDIHIYLKTLHEKENCKYNLKTISYLITKQSYGEIQLQELGIGKDDIRKAFGTLTIGSMSKYVIRNSRFKIVQFVESLYMSINSFARLR